MRDGVLVTVIVPVYNVENYLKQCVNSITSQTYINLEIILVDDGSTDSSGEICDEYEKMDERIKVIHKRNGGLSDARNAALDVCKGEYISFVDSDDYISVYFIEILIKEMKKGNCEIVALKRGTSYWDGEEMPLLAVSGGDYDVQYYTAQEALEIMLYQMIATGAPFKVYHRSIFKDIRFPVGYLYEDVATTYKTFLKAEKVAIVTADLYAYCMRQNSIIRQKFSGEKLIALRIFDQLVHDIDLINYGLEKAAASRVYAMLYSVFLQVPEDRIDIQKIVWQKLKTVQTMVMFDSSKLIRKKNKYAAWISLLGMKASYRIGRKFGQKGSMN